MKKKLFKYIKFIICVTIIFSLVAPSYASLSASDGSAFVTKAEFDSALADFNSRLTTFEAGINSKIDSQVTSYLDRNGIWSGSEQDFICPIENGTKWTWCVQGGGSGMFPVAGPLTKSGLLFFSAPMIAFAGSDYSYFFLMAIKIEGWDKDIFKNSIQQFETLAPGGQLALRGATMKREKKCLDAGGTTTGGNANAIYVAYARPDTADWQKWAGVPTPIQGSILSQTSPNKKEFTMTPSLPMTYTKLYAGGSSGAATSTPFFATPAPRIGGGWNSGYTVFTNYTGQAGHYFLDTQMFVQKDQILWLDFWGWFSIWTDKNNPCLFSNNQRDYGTRASLCIY